MNLYKPRADFEFSRKEWVPISSRDPKVKDKGRGVTRRIKGSINFDLIEKVFDIPEFIKLKRKEKAVFCKRCWCDIVEGQTEKQRSGNVRGVGRIGDVFN